MFANVPFRMCSRVVGVSNKVIASEDLPKDLVSLQFDASLLCKNIYEPNLKDTEFVGRKEFLAAKSDWIRAIQIANDCHSCNVCMNLCSSDNNKVILQIVKPVSRNEELFLWFSDEILVRFEIPFLEPKNIQGEKKYVCTKCTSVFEYPNHLKVHISLKCGTLPKETFWKRLKNSSRTVSPIFDFQEWTKSALDLTTNVKKFDNNLLPQRKAWTPDFVKNASTAHEEISIRPDSEPLRTSAFKPYPSQHFINPFSSALPYNHNIHNFTQLLEHRHKPPVRLFTEPSQQNESFDRIESLVSSMGKSSMGHLCIYCGKCYSRKYGLKIHIRTHTGYKPLRCKYCLRPFGDPSNLNKHVRLHSEGETPYKCNICSKILVRRRDLERHIKSRHMNEISDCSTEENESVTNIKDL